MNFETVIWTEQQGNLKEIKWKTTNIESRQIVSNCEKFAPQKNICYCESDEVLSKIYKVIPCRSMGNLYTYLL